jgi:hypothetical protein
VIILAIKRKKYLDMLQQMKDQENLKVVAVDDKPVKNSSGKVVTPMESKNAIAQSNKKTTTKTSSKKTSTKTKTEDKDTWFRSGAFSDGYQIGDVTKTILGTTGDIGLNVIKGVANIGEGIGDLISYGHAGIEEMLGDEESAEARRKKASENYMDELFKPANDYLDNYSVLGDKSDQISQGLGYVGAMVATAGLGSLGGLGTVGNTVLTSGLMGTSAMGSGMGEAYQGGATDEEALTYGVLSGATEVISELIFGGLGKGANALGLSKGLSSLDDAVAKKVSNKISSTLGKNLAEYGIKATAEGAEEIIAGLGSATAKKLTYMSEEEIGQLIKDEKLLEQFVVGTITSSIAQTPSLVSTTVANRDFITNYTQSEQKVIDTEVENRVNEQQEKTGKELTNKEVSKIMEQVESDFKKGYISTDTIENTLLAEDNAEITALQERLAQETDPKSKADIQSLIHMNELNRQTNLDNLLKDNQYFQESYNEKARKNQSFTYEASDKMSEQRKAIYESAKELDLNNTNKTHETIDLFAKIAEDRKTNYKLVNNAKLEELGYSVEGATIDGLVTGKNGEVLINIESPKALNKIVGHETTHLLEGTEEYTDLQDFAIEYAKAKGDYQSRVDTLNSLYKDTNADIKNELTSDIVGEYLFTDEQFINDLSTQKPNVFQKVYNYIKHLYKMATAGSTEARQLEQLKYKFEKAYNKNVSNNNNADTKYSLTDNQNRTLTKEQQEYFKDSKARDENGNLLTVYHGTPNKFTKFDRSKLGDNTITYGNTGFGHFVTPNKEFSQRFLDIDETGATGNVMELYANVTNPITHPYMAEYKYSGEELDNIVRTYYEAIDNQEAIKFLEETMEEEGIESLYEAYRYIAVGLDTDPFEYSADEYEKLKAKGYDAVEIVEGLERNLVENSTSDKPVISYAVFESNQLKNTTNKKPTSNPDIRYSLSEDTDIDDKINSSMTMEEARDMVQRAFNTQKDFVEYETADEWLKADPFEVGMIIENTESLIYKYINSNPDIVNEEYTIDDVLDAYLNGTLVGKTKTETKRLDLSKNTSFKDSRFYAPHDIEGGIELYEKANQRVTKNNSQEIYRARANFIINAHNKGYIESLGLTQSEVNSKLKSWANYPVSAMKLSNELNEGVAKQNQWTGIENSSIVNTLAITEEELNSMVKEIRGQSSDYQRRYITSAMLALDTHIDYSVLTFEFEEKPNNSYLGLYDSYSKTIYISPSYKAGQNTIAHEIGHYIDEIWGKEIFGFTNGLTTLGRNQDLTKLTTEQRQFVENFNNFITDLEATSDIKSDYTMKPTEVFARFVGKFTEWTKNQATNNRYGYEDKYYKDNFTTAQFKEFAKLLQEKSMLDTTKEQYSLSPKNQDIAPTGSYNVYGKDLLKQQVEEAIAPLQEQIRDLTNQLARDTLSYTKPAETPNMDETAPLNVMEKEQDIDSIAQNEIAPIAEDTTPDTMPDTTVESLFDTRNYEEVGDRKVNAYQYDNPEVKPFFQEVAQEMLYDLENTTKGERGYNDQAYYDSNGQEGWYGTDRQTTEDIAELLDGMDGRFKLSYDQIRKGLNAIIKDEGAENNVASKRIEFYIEKRLLEGYTNVDGFEIPANQDYINLKKAKQATEYNTEVSSTLSDNDIPYVEAEPAEITPKIQKGNTNITNYAKVPVNPNMKAEKNNGFKIKSDNEIVANVLADEQTTVKDKNKRTAAIILANIADKGLVFENLALRTKNRELQAKWDYTLTSQARGQYIIGKGHFDQGTHISKSLNEIMEEVGNTGYSNAFSTYMYHLLNIDRMTLKERHGIDNKPVFGESVTADVSREMVKEYEAKFPKFKEYAQDVYDYVNADRELLVKNDVISEQTAELWSKMYPHYVPIRRTGHAGNAINVPLDTNRTSINAPIKRATGGNSDILPMFDTIALRTLQIQRATAKNNFGLELERMLNTSITSSKDTHQITMDEILDSIDNQDKLLQKGDDGNLPTFTVFKNGEKITFEITEDMYDALSPLSDSSLLGKTSKILNTANNIRRGLLTEYNPVFWLTNAVKDVQDVLLNSQHATKTYAKIPEAYAQLVKKGYWYKEYVANGGEQNSYFDSQDISFTKESLAHRIYPLKKISDLNNFIEMAPRLAEYIASREAGRSIETSMLDASRVTTNFKAGGDLTKFLNRNGFTFLNASVQGAMQQVRNVREANANGLKGWANLATKFAIAGLPALLLNGMLWGDDDEYEELSDYVKQSYYIIGKNEDGTFIRIPKGRAVAVIQDALTQMGNLITGNDKADLKSFLDLVVNNLAPNNPLENNIIAPISQAISNKTWYGEDLVPSRLQDLPEAEQFDESTDSFSKWLGEMINVSPVKINYLIDQYSGGVGDVILPMLTPEAENGSDSIMGDILAPFNDKFTTNSTLNNQNVSDFYDLSDKLVTEAKKSKATDEDVIKNKYINSVKSEMNDLYKEKREVQNSNLSDSEKYDKVLEIQDKINSLARNALDIYDKTIVKENYSSAGSKEFYKNTDGEWTAIKEKELESLNDLSMSIDDKDNYFRAKNAISEIQKLYDGSDDTGEKKVQIIETIRDSELNDEQMAYLYDKYYASTEKLDIVNKCGIGMSAYLDLEAQNFTADKDADGDSISGSKKAKIFNYINDNLDIPFEQKVFLAKMYYPSYDEYNYELIDYLNNEDSISYDEMVAILETLDFKVTEDGDIYWD